VTFDLMPDAYTIYFHDDLDGTTSSAAFLRFFRERGKTVKDFVPVNYGPTFKSDWPDKKFSRPFVVVDFAYHPRAEWWFDHHQNPFVREEWKTGFKNDEKHFWDNKAPSCCGQVYGYLSKKFDFKFPPHFKELADEVDIMDGGLYKSIEDSLSRETPVRRIALSLECPDGANADYKRFLIQELSEKPAGKVAESGEVRRRFKSAKAELDRTCVHYKKNLEKRGRVAYIDNSLAGIETMSFANYDVYPDALYNVNIDKFYHGRVAGYHLSIGSNIMKREEVKVNLGDLVEKYNGGGHKYVAGIDLGTREEALRVAEYFVNYLNKNG